MNIGSIGKAIASQAMETTKKSVMDAVTGPEAKKPGEMPAVAPKSSAGIDLGAIILGQIQAMQRPLRDDQELQVSLSTAHEVLRVQEVFVPNSAVLVFCGVDDQKNVTRIIVPADQVHLVCKIIAVPAGATAKRVNVLTPKPRAEAGAIATPAPSPAQNS